MLTFLGLSLLALRRGGLGHPVQVTLAAAVVVCLVFGTLVSPFSRISPGLIPIFGSLALLMALRLHDIELQGSTAAALRIVLGISLVFGTGLALNWAWSDRLALTTYNAFYPELLGNMVTISDKPVLTFATHSLAAYALYLFFYLGYTAWRMGATWPRRVATLWLLWLLWRLGSTTSAALSLVAAAQLAVLLVRRHQWLLPATAVLTVAGAVIAWLLSELTLLDMLDLTRDALLGSRVSGLISRYADGGLLVGNFRFLSEHPLRPIGIGFTPDLFLGDSGVLLVLLRGSLPLVVAVYGGLFALLHYNLQSRAVATWIFIVTVVFEVGFTPLQFYRFVGLVPLLIVAFNGILAGSDGGRRYTEPVAPPRDP